MVRAPVDEGTFAPGLQAERRNSSWRRGDAGSGRLCSSLRRCPTQTATAGAFGVSCLIGVSRLVGVGLLATCVAIAVGIRVPPGQAAVMAAAAATDRGRDRTGEKRAAIDPDGRDFGVCSATSAILDDRHWALGCPVRSAHGIAPLNL